ncbi:MAG: T9SS type A sorting domain-containing protein [Bacteroidota bacterium]|jgi:subtilisin-like proprotein convertase family protein
MKKNYFLILLFLFSLKGNSQSLLINPTAEGGFEFPGGLPGNGWTAVNSSINTWNVSGTAIPKSGLNSAYISSDGGISYAYNNAVFQTSHFYRDVAIPAGHGSINLKFQYKSIGESYFDRLLVYAAPNNVFPAVDQPQSSNDVIAGATLIYMDPGNVSGYQQVNLFLPASFAGTTCRLIFSWQNDNNSALPTSPASIDDIYLYSQPIAPLNGLYTINNTLPTSSGLPASGSNFNSFTDAINYLNANGISGSVVFNVSAGQVFTESPQTILIQGTNLNQIVFQKSGIGANPKFVGNNGLSNADACFTVKGADYVTFDGIDVETVTGSASNNQQMEYGFYIINENASNGSNHITIKNSKIILNRANNATCGIFQWSFPAPSSPTQANNSNSYIGNKIENSFMGIYILGSNSAGVQDDSTLISGNTIGAILAKDIGGGNFSNATAGIWCSFQKNIVVKNNIVQNVSSQAETNGIYLQSVSGNCEISGNKVNEILNNSTSSTAISSGIRALLVTGTHNLKIFNNFISGVRTNNAGVNATSLARGINIPAGGSSASVYEVTHNSVYIDSYSSLGTSNSCLEYAGNSTTGPQIRVRSNIFANFTGAQSGSGKHYCYRTTTAGIIGSTGSLSNNNDFYIANTTNGFIGRGGTLDYIALSNWQTAYSQDGNSISVDPVFTAPDDLHAVNSALNSSAAALSLTPYITIDIDGESRTSPNSDMGADEFTPYLFDIKPVSLVNPATTGCYSSNESVGVRIMNYTGGFLDFVSNPVALTVEISGPVTQTVSTIINSNVLNGNAPLGPFSFLTVPVSAFNMSAYGNYNFIVYTSWSTDQNHANDTLKNVTRVNIAPSVLPQVVSFSGFTGSNLGSVFNGWSEASGTNPIGSTSQWSIWNNFGTTGNVNAVVTLNTNIRREWIIGPKIIPGVNTVMTFKAAVTAVASSNNLPAAMGSDDKLYVMISTDCGVSYQKIDSIYNLSNINNTLSQFVISLGAYNGQSVIIGFLATDGNVIDPGGCDLHLDDINISNVTTYDLSVKQLISPLFTTCFTPSQNIVVTVKNEGSIPIDFASENSNLHVQLTGPIPQSFNLPLNTGVLMPGVTQSYTVTGNCNLMSAGMYYLKSYLTIPSGDVNSLNDTLNQVVYSQNPSVSFSNYNLLICQGDSIQLLPNYVINGIGSVTLPKFFSNHAPISIPDGDTTGIISTINVSGAGGFASQLVNITIDSLIHTFVGDLVLTLIAPDGSSINLSANNGGGGDNYVSTLFTPSASNLISSASAPFTGIFIPQQSFTKLTGMANGAWKLKVKDISINDVGSLIKWSISFKEPNQYTNFSWSNTLGLSGNTLNPNASPASNMMYKFTIVDMNGCSVSDSLNLNVFNKPAVSINPVQSNVCLNGGLLTINANPIGGFFLGNGVDSTGSFDPALAGSGNSLVTYNFTDSVGCSSSDSVLISVLPTPQVDLQLTLSNVCSTDAVFTLSGETPSGGIFSGNGVQTSGLFDPSDSSALGVQTIYYSFTDSFGCSAQASDTMTVSLCLGNYIAENSVSKVFPNPTDGIVFVDHVGINKSVAVRDVNGKLIYQANSNSERISFDLSEFESGVYFISVTDPGNSTINFRVIKN